MAIIIIAPISLIIATDNRNSFKLGGKYLPNKIKIPKAKAISVAEGIA
jgi:hypothetical protein